MGRQAKSTTGGDYVNKVYVGYFKTAQQTTVISSNLTYVENSDKITVGNFGNTHYLKKRFLNQRSKSKNEKNLTSTAMKNCQFSLSFLWFYW